jgi:hypothetical protein
VATLTFRVLLLCSLALAVGCSKEAPRAVEKVEASPTPPPRPTIASKKATQAAEKVEAVEGKPQAPLTEDDFRILDVVLIDLLDFEDFIGSGRGNDASKIVLDTMTVGDFSGSNEQQFTSEFNLYEGQADSGGLGHDLSRRNPKEPISLAGYKTPSPKILLEDQGALISSQDDIPKEDAYNKYRFQYTPLPNVNRFVIAWLPGYSKDGNTAVFRAHFGPYIHGATLTYKLARKDGKWTVVWRFAAHYK